MRLRLLSCAALIAAWGCAQPDLAPCGSVRCPGGSTCVENELCATPAQLEACDGAEDGARCTVGGGMGECDRGVCLVSVCGNGVEDPGEDCDDGNTSSGDGCRADCAKVELCGDSMIDDGEGCDDGNTNVADGCDACRPTTWRASARIGGMTSATSVALDRPHGVAVDPGGNVYIADTGNDRIWRVDATGVITAVAGTGIAGSAGDGGVGTSAQLRAPNGVAVDGLGNVYIADTQNHRVRRVDPNGVIATLAGTGLPGYAMIEDNKPAASARLNAPGGLAVDGLGNVFIADTNNHRIRRIGVGDGTITTVAGNGMQGFSADNVPAVSTRLDSPTGIAVTTAGVLYIADSGNHRIRRVDVSGEIATIAGDGNATSNGDGPATARSLNRPAGVAIDSAGVIYIADEYDQRIRRVENGNLTTIAGMGGGEFAGDGGLATAARMNFPSGVAVDGAGNVFIADHENYRIRRVTKMTGVITTMAGTFGETFAAGATTVDLNFPAGAAVDVDGNLYIGDSASQRIRRVSLTGVMTNYAGGGFPSADSGDNGQPNLANLSGPRGLAIDTSGALYIADSAHHRIRRVDPAGLTITTFAGTGSAGSANGPLASATFNLPTDLAFDEAGTLYVADRGSHRIRKIANGTVTTLAGIGTPGFSGETGLAVDAALDTPQGIAVDGDGVLYIADSGNHRIRTIVGGTLTTIAGTATPGTTGVSPGAGGDGGPASLAQLWAPRDVVVDSAGVITIADTGNSRVRSIDGVGTITTITGGSSQYSLGDGGPPASARFFAPAALELGPAGSLYVVDDVNNRVRRIAAGVITTVAGQVDPEGTGPLDLEFSRLADPRGLVITPAFTLFAGGASGTAQAARADRLEVVGGRYPHEFATDALARFRAIGFDTVGGIAFDAAGGPAAAGLIVVSESPKNRLHVITIVDPSNRDTWTIATLANATGTAGYADGPAQAAQFRGPTGLYLDATTRTLYIADTGNHVIRAIDLAGGVASASVRTVAGTPATRGYAGDGDPATSALLYAPEAITRCSNGDFFIADTANHRVRRIAAVTGAITTVLGDGVGASSGEGSPAATFPVNAPRGLACDAIGNLFVTSTTAVRLLPANSSGVVDGSGGVQTIYGAPPRATFPASVTSCLTGLAIVNAVTVQVTDSCSGILVELKREQTPP